jgi:chromosome segregation ATPase
MAHNGSSYWNDALISRFGTAKGPNSDQDIVKYLNAHMKECQNEQLHFKSAEHCYTAFYEYCTLKRGSGIIGLVCDIAWFDDERIARVISKKRYMAMMTVLTEYERDVHRFKKAITDNGRGPRSFLPVSSAPPPNTIDPDLERVKSDNITFPGFIGFAVNMVRLRPEHENLRYSVFWGLFRDLMLFDTLESASEYSRFLTVNELEKFWVVTLDRYSDEELASTYPCMRSRSPRHLTAMYDRTPWQVQAALVTRLHNAQNSYELARYSY